MHFLKLEVISIAVVVEPILLNAASLNKVLKLENLVLQIFELFLTRYDSFCYVVSIKFILRYNIH